MPAQLPRYQTGVGVVEMEGTISFGNSLPLSFDGNHSFSVAGWFQVAGHQQNGVLVGKSQEFVFGLNDGVLYAQLAGQLSPVTAGFRLDEEWHFLVATFANNGPGSGTLTLYMDGAQVGQSILNNVGTTNQGQPLVIGGNLHITVWCLCLYTTALAQSNTKCMWMPDRSGTGLVASYAFMQAPPRDLTGNNNPITFTPQAAEQITTPGVNLMNTAYCRASSSDGVNPGGGGNDKYTIQAWLYPNQTGGTQYVFSNGLVDGSAVSLYLTAGLSSGQMIINTKHGTDTLIGGTVSTNAWSNVAVTYDGQTLTLYINGQQSTTKPSASMPPVSQSNPFIGAGLRSAIPNITGFFQGLIQSVDVWNVSLSAADLNTYMVREPYGANGCTAIYTLTDTAANGITGSSIGLYNGARLDALVIKVPRQVGELYETASRLRITRTTAAEVRHVPTSATGIVVQPVAPEQVARALEVFNEMLPPSLDSETKNSLRELFLSGMTDANQSLVSGRPIPGTITHQLEGDDYVFYHHTASGAEECLRLPATDTDQCTAWTISIVGTIIIGFLGVFSVPFTSARVTDAVARVINNSPLGRAIIKQLNEEVTGRSIIAAITLLYTSGSLGNVISQILADLSWWDFLFVVGGVTLQFIEIMFPNPSSMVFYALMLAKMGAMIIQVTVVFAQKPPGC
jgi:hypothetical protein